MAHPEVFVAQTTAAHVNHFYKAVLRANEYKGPAVIITYTTCQPEHGVGDHLAGERARLAVDSRTFPLIMYDPEAGERIKERLSLKGNPALGQGLVRRSQDRRSRSTSSPSRAARGGSRSSSTRTATPSPALMPANEDRRRNWRMPPGDGRHRAGEAGRASRRRGRARSAGDGRRDALTRVASSGPCSRPARRVRA